MSPKRILVIPGLGDIHWVALKLQSFIRHHGLTEPPEVHIWNFDGRPRSLDFVRRIPFVRAGGYWDEPLDRHKKLFNEVYMTGARDVVEGTGGFDWLICVNGSLRVGRRIDTEILPKLETDWNYPLTITEAEDEFGRRIAAQVGPYVLLYFSDHGMFRQWIKHWPAESIRRFIAHLQSVLPGHRLILTGSSWDAGFNERLVMPGVMNLCGKTTLDELLGLVRRASAFAGWCGGNTILSTHLNTPTVMLWSDYFRDRRFQTNWIDAARLGAVYQPRNVEQTTPEAAACCVAELLARQETKVPA